MGSIQIYAQLDNTMKWGKKPEKCLPDSKTVSMFSARLQEVTKTGGTVRITLVVDYLNYLHRIKKEETSPTASQDDDKMLLQAQTFSQNEPSDASSSRTKRKKPDSDDEVSNTV